MLIMDCGQRTNHSMQQFETDFDKTIGKINIIPQDIGRVILNLINNAFYAVNEKQKTEYARGYEPTVTVSYKSTL